MREKTCILRGHVSSLLIPALNSLVFADTYGWSCDLEALGNYADVADAATRDSSHVELNPSSSYTNSTWEIELPNGLYRVGVGYANPTGFTFSGCTLEGAAAFASGVPTTRAAGSTYEHVSEVLLTDGRLTFDGIV